MFPAWDPTALRLVAPMRGIANLRSQPPHRGILRISPTNILLTHPMSKDGLHPAWAFSDCTCKYRLQVNMTCTGCEEHAKAALNSIGAKICASMEA